MFILWERKPTFRLRMTLNSGLSGAPHSRRDKDLRKGGSNGTPEPAHEGCLSV